MALVVFFRAANVGGYQKFKPAAIARELREFDVVNFGAAGTFLVRGKITAAKLRAEILQRLSIKPEMMICAGRELLDLAESDPFARAPIGEGIGHFVSILEKDLASKPVLPINRPNDSAWEVSIIAVNGRFALSVRRAGRKQLYSNEVVEKELAVAATTRSWNTIASILDALRDQT